MWIYASERPTHEDVRQLINMDKFRTVAVISDRGMWQVVASVGDPTIYSDDRVFLAQADTQEQAVAMQNRIFGALASGKTVLDLNAPELSGPQTVDAI